MKCIGVPASVIVFCLFLGFIALAGLMAITDELARWRSNSTSDVPILYLAGGAMLFCIVPVLAIGDMIKRRFCGLYFGLVPLLVVFGVVLRMTTEVILFPVSSQSPGFDIYVRMVSIGFAIALGTFILKLGFSKTVAAYFKGEPPA